MRGNDPVEIFRGPLRQPVTRWRRGFCLDFALRFALAMLLAELCLTGVSSAQAQQMADVAKPVGVGVKSVSALTRQVLARASFGALPRASLLTAAWSSVGPGQIASQSYGNVTGRVTSIAIDTADATGNTVYVGTTGGGVWKLTNAAGAASSVAFVPLTDTLPVFNANAGGVAMPSLSIGAISVGNGVVLAGTGDPNDATDSYYGEGILRSTDGGNTWTLSQQSNDGVAGHHSFVGLSVAGFAWSTTTPGLVVAALAQSAEGMLVNAPNTTDSIMGLYYSTDSGASWQMGLVLDGTQVVQMPSSAQYPGNAATSVVWNPVRQMFYAAVQYHGYYSSPDGISWTRLANQPGAGLTTTACPTNSGRTGNTSCPIFRGALAVQAATGDTFAVTVDANNLDQGLYRDVCGLSSGSCSTSTIAFGSKLTSAALEVGSGSTPTAIAQGDYNLSLAAVATGTGATADTLLFVGTVDLYRCSLGGGCTVLRNTTNASNGCLAPAMVSPAQHAIATLAGAEAGGTLPLIYLGNDGGLWRSVDGVNQQQSPCSSDDAKHFQNMNAGIGSLAEVVSFAQHPTDPATVLAGLGANGTAGTGSATATTAWPQISAGEGGVVTIDQTTPQNWYVSTKSGVSLRYCGSGSNCTATNFTGSPTIGYTQVDNDASLIYAPFLLDPALTTDVLIGTCRVWRGLGESGSAWPGSSAISTILGGAQNSACSASSNAMIRSLAAGGPASTSSAAQDAGSTVLYAGMAGSNDGGGSYGGHLFANYAAGTASNSTTWTDETTSAVTNVTGGVFNPGGFDISSLAADPHDATGMTVYATVMGFAGNGVNAAHVYRSTTGGTSWTNISSNLPNAPANAVLVDPNDANTLYVAMDSGVYVTITVTTCATATVNCWSIYGTSLPNAPVVALAAASGMATGDGRLGELRAATYGRGIWEIPLLTAASPTAPAMTLSPTSLTFATQAVSTTSAAQTITVTNSGTASLTITQITASTNFTETNNCTSAAIAVNSSCTVWVEFLPSTTGSLSGVLTIYGNVVGGQATALLNGTGASAAAIALNPLSLNFAATSVGATSAAQSITISNTGGVTTTLQTPVLTGDFIFSANTCGTTLGAGTGCTVSIEFKPTAAGVRSGNLSITDSVGTQTATLSGTGQLPATDTLSPMSLTFAAQQINTTSTTLQVTLTNNGDAALTLISAVIVSGDFTMVNGCGNSLIGHSTCALTVAFVPKSVGAQTGSLTVSDINRSQSVVLNGTGLAPAGVSLSPASPMTFAATGVGLTSSAQTITLTNNGGVALAIQSMAPTGDFSIVAGSSNTCGTSLAAGAACTLQIVFAPTAQAARTGSFTVVDNAASSPQTLQLAGTGVDFALVVNGSASQTIAAGSTAVYSLLLASNAGVPGTATLTCSGAPANATCVVNPSSATLGGTTVITVTVETNVADLRWQGIPGGRGRLPWLALMLPVGILGVARRRARRIASLALLCFVCAIMGCGTGRVIPSSSESSGGNPTPSGTYNLTVSGISAGITHSIGLTLIVQ